MYGGMWCFIAGEFKKQLFSQAKEKPSPLSDRFDKAYFDDIISSPEYEKLSIKALLATEQRIPVLVMVFCRISYLILVSIQRKK